MSDELGTIRRHPEGSVAVLTPKGWVWIDVNGDVIALMPSPEWPVIFEPGVAGAADSETRYTEEQP